MMEYRPSDPAGFLREERHDSAKQELPGETAAFKEDVVAWR
jgi:hypothetical protein